MKTKIKIFSTALCAAVVVFCFAACPSDPEVVYKETYAHTYARLIAHGCSQKLADEEARGNAYYAREQAMGGPKDYGSSGSELGFSNVQIPEQDMSNRAAAVVQTGGTHIPAPVVTPAASTVCTPMMHR